MQTMARVWATKEEVFFETVDGRQYHLYHEQECCESVFIEDISGDLSDLEGEPLILCEEVSSKDIGFVEPVSTNQEWESETWTFYKFGTIKGYVTIRWYGTSNGYYSEGVDFECIR
jgi:hypothetical protein